MRSLILLTIIVALVNVFPSNSVAKDQKEAVLTPAQKKVKECKYYLRMGNMNADSAYRAYQDADYIKADKKVDAAYSNYMAAALPCFNTELEKKQHKAIADINKVRDNGSIKSIARVQKFLKK